MTKPACVYLPLEPVQSRYTSDLCNEHDGWMTCTLRNAGKWRAFYYIHPKGVARRSDIKTGAVLDATTRNLYAMAQCAEVCKLIDAGKLKNGDALYLQDFWTPGFESILYCAHMANIRLRIYAMVHAQSVDQYDFTYSMRSWMRPIELGLANAMDGLFVASSIHKEQLQLAGVTCSIHVVSLPFNAQTATERYNVGHKAKTKQVIFSSRIDAEKQPWFMLKVAHDFLLRHPDWRWVLTTSASKLRSYNNAGFIKELRSYSRTNKRFIIKEGLSKQEYHDELDRSLIQFNCSLQDYVSWTLIEAVHHSCYPVYPNFRSFPECLPPHMLYTPWSIPSAVNKLKEAVSNHGCGLRVRLPWADRILAASYGGRQVIASTVFYGTIREYNIWSYP